MTNKQKLISYIEKNGRKESWLDLALLFDIKVDGNNRQRTKAANDIWRNYIKYKKFNNSNTPDIKEETLTLSKKWFNGKTWCESYSNNSAIIDNKKEMIVEAINETLSNIKFNDNPYFKLKDKSNNEKILLELSIPDIHLGKKSYKDETDEEYDLEKALKLFKDAVVSLTNSVDNSKYTIDKILFPIGNDFFNADGAGYATFNKTPQHEDANWKETFSAGIELVIQSIEYLKTKANSVDVLFIPGNHDRSSVFYLSKVISKTYAFDKMVNVDDSAKDYKYYQYGKNMIYFNHGDEIKFMDIPLIMAVEQPQMFAECTHREAHLGHFHKEMVHDIKGIKLRYLPSLSPTDAWHKMKGFVGSNKEALGFIWSIKGGIKSIIIHTV
jgi:hypothetical protein